jgi:hypothetical protein
LLDALRDAAARGAAAQGKPGENQFGAKEKAKRVFHAEAGALLSQARGARKQTQSFLRLLSCPVSSGRMLELEVYAAGVRDLNKILELDHELGTLNGLRYKVDSNHDIVYLEMEEPTVTFREIRATFRKLGLDPRFVGAIPQELRPKTKTQPLNV